MNQKVLYNSSSCKGFKCKKINKSSLKFYNTKHKFTPSCFNSCVDWTLNISFTQDKTSYSHKLRGKNLFFCNLEKSALNVLTTQGGLQDKDIYESPTFSELSTNQLKTNENGNQNNFNELLNIKFPINNKTFNYMIIDANLAIKENLQNIFLLEFDLVNSNKDNKVNQFMKLLREINNNSTDREIFFVLNGTIHGVQMFSSELKFSVEQRKFIKSIQFKLESYKKDLINQKEQHPNSPQNLKIKKTFFAKVLSNTNIGIEFSKPHFDMRNPEKFQTNFNSIVNAKININKIFLEVSIPKIFLCNSNYNDCLTRIDNKIEDNPNIIKDIKLDKFNDNNSNEKTASSFASNTLLNNNNNETNNNSNSINNNNKSNNNKEGFNSPIFCGNNNNNNIYCKSSLRNKQINIPGLNNNFNIPCSDIKDHSYNSPHLGYNRFMNQQNYISPGYFPLLFGGRNIPNNNTMNNNNNNINNSTFSSSIHFSPNFGINSNINCLPLSPGGRSYIATNNQIIFNGFNNNTNQIYPNIQPFELDPNGSILSKGYSENSIFSESCNKSPNSVVGYSNNYYNFNFNNNFNLAKDLSYKSFGRASFYEGITTDNIFNKFNSGSLNLNLNSSQGYMSPRNVSNLNFDNLNSSEDQKIFTGIPTVMRKIIDWEKSRGEEEIKKDLIDNFGNDKAKGVIANSSKPNNNHKENIKDVQIKNDDKKNSEKSKEDYFIEHYEGKCNFFIFLRNATTYININSLDNYKDITLDNYFKSFEKISLFGLKVNYFLNNASENDMKIIYNMLYSLTLSSMEIIINNKDLILDIVDNLISIKKCTEQIKVLIEENSTNAKNNYLEFYPNEKNTCLKIIIKNLSKLSIEYCENKPPHLRKNFYSQIKEILKLLKINNACISNIIGNSHFSIMFAPINSRNKNNIQTSFITYYHFKSNDERSINSNKYLEIPIIGLLPIKMNNKFFFEKINKDYQNCNNNMFDHMIMNRYIQNVTNIIIQNNNMNSIDVEYYLKNPLIN